MLAIYKKELKSYFHSMVGYVFMAFLLLVVGIYYYAYNFYYQSGNFEYVLNSVNFIFIILVPILTMKIMAEEKKQKTDQLLFTSAVPVHNIVLAKYLSILTLFGIVCAIVCVYPLILLQFGDVPLGAAYGSIFGFFILGAAFLAIGLFISSITDSQVIAAVIGFITFLVSYLISSLVSVLPSDKMSTMIIMMFLTAIVCYIVYLSIRKVVVGVGLFAASVVAYILTYIFHSSFYDSILTNVLNTLALTVRYDNFTYGIVNLSDVCYYLSVVFLFLMLTALFVKESLSDRKRKGSLYRTSLVLVVTVLVVAANLLVSQFDLSADFSSNRMYSITDETKDFVKNIDDDITIYYVVTSGNEDASTEKIVKKYDNLSSKIKVVTKDPAIYPTFASQYTDEEVADNSIIVVNNTTGTSKYVAYSSMYEYDTSSYSYSVTGIDVEGQITSALDYVTNTDLPVMYYTSGHGEEEIGSTVTTAIQKLNVSMNELATLTVSEIPEDCDILFINGPTSDISKEELTMIKLYLKNGGNAIITCAYTDSELTNFNKLLNYYGVYTNDGIVVEDSGYYISSYVTYCLPTYGSHDIVDSISEGGKYVVMPTSIGLTASDNTRDTLTLTDLLQTSEGAYSKVNTQSETVEKEDDDITGPFDLGILAEETESDSDDAEVITKVAVYGSQNLVNENLCGSGQFANTDVITNTINYMVDAVSNVSIPVKSVDTVYLTVSQTQANIWGSIVVVILPLAILVTGFVIWIRRRRS